MPQPAQPIRTTLLDDLGALSSGILLSKSTLRACKVILNGKDLFCSEFCHNVAMGVLSDRIPCQCGHTECRGIRRFRDAAMLLPTASVTVGPNRPEPLKVDSKN